MTTLAGSLLRYSSETQRLCPLLLTPIFGFQVDAYTCFSVREEPTQKSAEKTATRYTCKTFSLQVVCK
jgi:hypothetical protein